MVEFLAGLVLKLAGLNVTRKQEVAGYLEYIANLTAKFEPAVRNKSGGSVLHGYTTETQRIAKQFSSATSDVLNKKDLAEFQKLLDTAVNVKRYLETSPGADIEARLTELAEVTAAFRASAATLKGKASRIG